MLLGLNAGINIIPIREICLGRVAKIISRSGNHRYVFGGENTLSNLSTWTMRVLGALPVASVDSLIDGKILLSVGEEAKLRIGETVKCYSGVGLQGTIQILSMKEKDNTGQFLITFRWGDFKSIKPLSYASHNGEYFNLAETTYLEPFADDILDAGKHLHMSTTESQYILIEGIGELLVEIYDTIRLEP